MSRHLLVAAPALLALAACSVSQPRTAPQKFVIAQFDPVGTGSAGPDIPLPNDLVLHQNPNSLCSPPSDASAPACAEAELIQSFIDANGYPADQEVAVTIDFIETSFNADGTTTNTAPDLDLSTFTPSTFFVYAQNAAGTGEVPIDPLGSDDYVKYADHGTLTIHNVGHAPWPPGVYAVLVRGGDNGVKTTDGLPVNPSQIFYLLRQNVDLASPANNGLLKAQLGSEEAAHEQGLELNEISGLWNEFAFPAAATRFPYQELAILTQFSIQHQPTNVSIDPSRGL
ncbi:MAG TPA: hypothetical protein VG871_21735, partial [Vicinamibacterales bacterium]|nr:hypothetical protein [Vicinamibacterales bacterium]